MLTSLARSLRFLTACVLVAGAVGCGGSARTTSEPPRTNAPPSGSSGRAAAKAPQIGELEVDFAKGQATGLLGFTGGAGSGTVLGSSYRLKLTDGDAIRAPATMDVEPGDRSVVVIATIRAPTELNGRAGVFCRGSDGGRSGYELSVDKTGRVRLERVENGARKLLAGYEARIDAASPPDAPLPVILVCGGRKGASEVTLGVTVGVKALTFFDDPDPLSVQAQVRSGLVVSGGAPAAADFAAFKLRFERE